MNKKTNPNRRLRRIEAAILCALIIAVCASGLSEAASFWAGCTNVRENVVRLHVIANSDSDADQNIKLLVRDAVLARGAELFDGSVSRDDAAAKITPQIALLESAAQEVIDRNGGGYGAAVSVGEEYFPTRAYEGVTIPAGTYMAVKVTLGGGGGHNWWCVMFPPLCLPAARPASQVSLDAILTGGQLRIVQSNPKLEIRFKLVELWEGLLERLRK